MPTTPTPDPDDPIYLVHPMEGELFTPHGPRFLKLLQDAHDNMGNWRIVAWKAGLRLKVLRNLRAGKYMTVSLTTVDKIVVGCGVGSVDDFVWFTAQDLVRIGVWRETFHLSGFRRHYGGATWEVSQEDLDRLGVERRRLRRKELYRRRKNRQSTDRVNWIAIWKKEKYFPFR